MKVLYIVLLVDNVVHKLNIIQTIPIPILALTKQFID